MALDRILYKVSQQQDVQDELIDTYGAKVNSLVQQAREHYSTDAHPYTSDEHIAFVNALWEKFKSYPAANAHYSPVTLRDEEIQQFKRFVTQSCLVVRNADFTNKRDDLIDGIKQIKQRMLHALQHDFPEGGRDYKQLNRFAETIEANITQTYSKAQITNQDLDYLATQVGSSVTNIQSMISHLYQEKVPEHMHKLLYEDCACFLNKLDTQVHRRFNPVLMARNHQLLDERIDAEGRRPEADLHDTQTFFGWQSDRPTPFRTQDDTRVQTRTISVPGQVSASLATCQGGRPYQEDRVDILAFDVHQTVTQDALGDMMYDAIQTHVRQNQTAYTVGSTLNWSAIYQGCVITANIGDSQAFLVKAFEGVVTVDELSWPHNPEHPIEVERIVLSGATIVNNRIQGGLNVSRTLGDSTHARYGLISQPNFTSVNVDADESAYVLTVSDGVMHVMNADDIAQFLTAKGLDGNVADVLRREAYQRYPMTYRDNRPLLPDNISVAFAPVIYDPNCILMTTVEDGHGGTQVSQNIYENVRTNMLIAAAKQKIRIIPQRFDPLVRAHIQMNVIKELRALIELAQEQQQTDLQACLQRYLNLVHGQLTKKHRMVSRTNYQKSDMVQLTIAVIDVAASVLEEGVSVDEQANCLGRLSALCQKSRGVLVAQALLVGLVAVAGSFIGIGAGLLALHSFGLLGVGLMQTSAKLLLDVAGTGVVCGVASGIVAYSAIFNNPKAGRKAAAECVREEIARGLGS